MRPKAAWLLTPVSRSRPVFQSTMRQSASTNSTPSCMLSMSIFSNSGSGDSPAATAVGPPLAAVFPGQVAGLPREIAEPVAGELAR